MKWREYDEASGSWFTVDGDGHSDLWSNRGGGEVLTQQHFAEEVDVNTIVRRFGITREMPFGQAEGVYGDFTGILDYDSALEKITEAQNKFMNLPAEVREKFRNDPAELIRQAGSMEEGAFVSQFNEEVISPPAVP